jgi:uncharacterized protein YggE
MLRLWLVVLLLWAIEPMFGQLDTDTITVTASRQVALVADQAVFSISVITSEDSSLDQALALLQGSGITAMDLQSVYTYDRSLQWSFTLAVAFSKIPSTAKTLAGIVQNSTGRNGAAVSFNIQGTQVSDEQRQSQSCSTADLISDAQAQAQKLANAAGFTLGPILSLSDAGSVVSGQVLSVSAVFAVAVPFYAPVAPPVTCTATVKFSLQRFH